MNAIDVIEAFKRLPQEEKGKVVDFIRQDVVSSVRCVDDEVAKTAAESVFNEHPELFRKLAE